MINSANAEKDTHFANSCFLSHPLGGSLKKRKNAPSIPKQAKHATREEALLNILIIPYISGVNNRVVTITAIMPITKFTQDDTENFSMDPTKEPVEILLFPIYYTAP